MPRAQDMDDVYYSTSSGLDETREVFFAGCGLPERWADRRQFTVAELGFGTGLNMAALAGLWTMHRPAPAARLHLVSVEGRLMSREDAQRALSPWRDELGEPLELLLAQWPHRARGVQRMDLGSGVTLTLLQDDVKPALDGADFQADAWFLDGFSPAKNDAMWSPEVMAQIARLSAPGAVVGTYTVAGFVRRGLADAGFDVAKKPGFGRKRERLEAIWPETARPARPDPLLIDIKPERPARVAIIGAGIMGAVLACRFHQMGSDVVVFDGADGLEQGTSANPLALIMPRLDAGDTPAARAMLDAYLNALTFYDAFPDAVSRIDINQPASDEKSAQRFAKILKDPPLDETLLSNMDVTHGMIHRNGMIADPIALRRALLAGIDVRWNTRVSAIRAGRPAAYALENGDMGEAELIICAGGMGLPTLLQGASPPLAGRSGQLEWMEHEDGTHEAWAGGRYAIDARKKRLFGASFLPTDTAHPPHPDAGLRLENIEGLKALAPAVAARIDDARLSSRTGVRATTPDRLPFVGRLPDEAAYLSLYGEDLEKGRSSSAPYCDAHLPGLMVAGGLGARGFTWAPLLADIAIALANGGPMPTGRASHETLSPARFIMRDCKRGVRRPRV